MSLAFTGGGRVSPCLNKFSYEEQSLVIFDCDGVLVDSEQISAEIISSLLSQWNIQMDAITCQSKFHGFTMEAVVKWVNLKYGEVLDQEFLSNCREKTQKAFVSQLKPIAGIKFVLDTIKNPVCVASNGDLEKIKSSLRIVGLSKYFCGAYFSAEQVQQGKPSPDLFLYAAGKMNANHYKTIVVEDSLAGVDAAIAAKMSVLGYIPNSLPHAKKHRLAMREAGAVIFDDMEDLPMLLKEGGQTRKFDPN